jgi:hypothetical protein
MYLNKEGFIPATKGNIAHFIEYQQLHLGEIGGMNDDMKFSLSRRHIYYFKGRYSLS